MPALSELDSEQKSRLKDLLEFLETIPKYLSEIEELFGKSFILNEHMVAMTNKLITKEDENASEEETRWIITQRGKQFLEVGGEGALDRGFLYQRRIDHCAVAKDYCDAYPILYTDTRLWWSWSHREKCWKPIDETDILLSLKNAYDWNGVVNSRAKAELLEGFRINGRERFNAIKDHPKTWIQFGTKIIDYATCETHEPSPEYFIVNRIPWNLGKNTDTPHIDNLIKEWVSLNDRPEEDFLLLKELMAYCLVADYPIHRIFVLIGAGRNGKGTFLEILHRLIGRENITGISIPKLTVSKFHAAKVYRKLAAVAGETKFTTLEDTDEIKKLTGGDIITGEFKNKPEFDFKNYAKIIQASNSLPPTSDKTDGFYARHIIVDFKRQFEEERDILADIPESEYENLCRQLVHTLKELIERGKFTGEGNIQDRKARYEEKSNPLSKFIRLYCRDNVNSEIPKKVFRKKFEEFCLLEGVRALTNAELHRIMKDGEYESRRKRVMVGDYEENTWVWQGLCWKNNEIPDLCSTCSTSSKGTTLPLYIRNLITTSGTDGTGGTNQTNPSKKSSNVDKMLKLTSQEASEKILKYLDKPEPAEIKAIYSLWEELSKTYLLPDLDKLIALLLRDGLAYSPKPGFIAKS